MKTICFVFLLSILLVYVTAQESGISVSCDDDVVTVTTPRGMGFNNWYAFIRAPTGEDPLDCIIAQFERTPGQNQQTAEILCQERTDYTDMILIIYKYEDQRVMEYGDMRMTQNPIRCTLGNTATTRVTIKSSDLASYPIPNVDADIDIGLLASSDSLVFAFGETVTIFLSRSQANSLINVMNVYTYGPDGTKYYLIRDNCPYDFDTFYFAEEAEETKQFEFPAFVIFDPNADMGDGYEVELVIEVAVCGMNAATDCDFTGDCGIEEILEKSRRRRQEGESVIGSTNRTKTLSITVVPSEAEKNRRLQAMEAQQQALVSSVIRTEEAPDEKMCVNKTVGALTVALLSTGLISFFIATLFLILRKKKEHKLEMAPSSRRTVYSVSNKSLK